VPDLFHSVSASLQNGICFFHPPTPAHPVGSPCGTLSYLSKAGGYGVSTFHVDTTVNNLGSTPPPVTQHLRGGKWKPSFLITHLLVQACQHLRPGLDDDGAVVHMIVSHIVLS